MNACTDCLLRSVLQNEAIGFAERSMLPPDRARELLSLSPDEIIDRLSASERDVSESVAARVDQIREGPEFRRTWCACRHDGSYPAEFFNLAQPPWVLFGIGDTEMLRGLTTHHGVAIVGARRASAYGREVAYGLGRDLAAAGMTVISGMALGVDGAAHRGALQINGRTIAVLAGGPDRPYPRSHRLLYEQVIEHGAVLSERPPGSRAQRWGFPARNRLIAALSLKTILVEGTERSGAMHTVGFAEELGQTAVAVPGPVTSPLSAGPNKLLFDQGGGIVRNARDVLDQIYLVDETLTEPTCAGSATVKHASPPPALSPPQPPPVAETLPPHVRAVYQCVRTGESTPSAIGAELAELAPRKIVTALGELELAGYVERDERGGYRTCLGARGVKAEAAFTGPAKSPERRD